MGINLKQNLQKKKKFSRDRNLCQKKTNSHFFGRRWGERRSNLFIFQYQKESEFPNGRKMTEKGKKESACLEEEEEEEKEEEED